MYKVIILVAAACLSLSTSSFSGAGLPQVRALTIASGAETQQKVSNTASSEEKSQVHEQQQGQEAQKVNQSAPDFLRDATFDSILKSEQSDKALNGTSAQDKIVKNEQTIDQGSKLQQDGTNQQKLPNKDGDQVALAQKTSKTTINKKGKSAPKKLNVQTEVQLESSSGSGIRLEQKAEVEVDPSHRNKVKQMMGVYNPLDETENRIRSQMDTHDNYDLQPEMNFNLFAATHKNFDAIYNTLQGGFGDVKDSHINEEKSKYGDNNKAMGAESHRESTAAVRKEETKMGNLQNIQLEQPARSDSAATNLTQVVQQQSDDQEQIEVEKVEDSLSSQPIKIAKISSQGKLKQHAVNKQALHAQDLKKVKAPIKNSKQTHQKVQTLSKKHKPSDKHLVVKSAIKPKDSKKVSIKPGKPAVVAPAIPKPISKKQEKPSSMSDETTDLLQEAKSALETQQAAQDKAKQQLMSQKIKSPSQEQIQLNEMDKFNDNSAKAIPNTPPVADQGCQTSHLDQLLAKGNEFKVQLADDGQSLTQSAADATSMSFYVLPKDSKNGVTKEIQVLNSERIIGYSTYSGLMRGDKDNLQDHSLLMLNDDADYYNVTLNLIVKKGGQPQSEPAPTLQAPATPPPPAPAEPLPKPVVQSLPQATKDPLPPAPAAVPKDDAPPPKDLSRVELATESSSSYEAAASLDVSSQESKKEIAESEHYLSRIAKQQATSMISEGSPQKEAAAANNDLLQWQDVAPPADVNAQVADSVDASDGATLEQQSVLQLQNDVRMKPRSQLDDQVLLQLHSKTKSLASGGTLAANKRNARSADTFDQGDGSAHKDEDADQDLAQAEALRKETVEKPRPGQELTQATQTTQEQAGAEASVEQQARQNQLQREELAEARHKSWMKKLAAKGMAAEASADPQSPVDSTVQQDASVPTAEAPVPQSDSQKPAEPTPEQPSEVESEQGPPVAHVQQLSRETAVHRRPQREQPTPEVPTQEQEQSQEPVQAQPDVQATMETLPAQAESQPIPEAPSQEEQPKQSSERVEQALGQYPPEVEVSRFSEDETQQRARLAQESEATQSSQQGASESVESESSDTQSTQQNKESQASESDSASSTDKSSDNEEDGKSDPTLSTPRRIDPYDQAMRKKTEKWAKEAETEAKTGSEEQQSTAGRSRLIEDKDKSATSKRVEEPYDIPAEDKVIDKEEQRLDEIREAEAEEKAQREKQEQEVQAKRAAERKLIEEIAAKQAEARKAKEAKLLEKKLKLKEELQKQRAQREDAVTVADELEEDQPKENSDDRLFKEQEMIENHIEHELKVLEKIVQKRRKEGAKHLHQYKLVREDMDDEKEQAEKEAAQKAKEAQEAKEAKEAKEAALRQKDEEAQLAKKQEKKAKKRKALKALKHKKEVEQQKKQQEEQKQAEREAASRSVKNHQQKTDPILEHEMPVPHREPPKLKKSMQLLKKKTAALSEEFEAEERRKRQSRENQIRMLEATKRKLQEADSFDQKGDETKELKKKEKKEKKEKKTKKESKWPKMEIQETAEPKPEPAKDVKTLLKLNQISSTAAAKEKPEVKAKKEEAVEEVDTRQTPKVKDSVPKAVPEPIAQKPKQELKKNPISEQPVQHPVSAVKAKPQPAESDEDATMKETQNELQQIQKDLEDAQKQADSYQKEKEEEQIKQKNLIEKLNHQKQEQKHSEDIIQAAKASLASIDEKQDVGISKEEKEALDKVNKAKEQGEKIGAEAAAKLLQQAKGQSLEENTKQFSSLKKKLKDTSQQVLDIVQNFQRVHTDLQDLKEEYIQQKLQELDSHAGEDDNQNAVQLSQQVHMSQELRSESLQNIQKSIKQKKEELRSLMSSFAVIKGELSQISKEKDRIEENQELLQLEQLRATLGETIDESEKVGADDLLQLDQTVGSELIEGEQAVNQQEQTTLIDSENVQLSEDAEVESPTTVAATAPSSESNLLQLSEELLRAEQSNHVIQARINRLLA